MHISKFFTPLSSRAIRGGALALVAATTLIASAQAQTKVRVTLDWVPQSTHGPTFIAQYPDVYRPV